MQGLTSPRWVNATNFADLDRDYAIKIIDAIEKTMKFDDTKFEWDAMRTLIDYYSDVREGGDGNLVVLDVWSRGLMMNLSGSEVHILQTYF